MLFPLNKKHEISHTCRTVAEISQGVSGTRGGYKLTAACRGCTASEVAIHSQNEFVLLPRISRFL